MTRRPTTSIAVTNTVTLARVSSTANRMRVSGTAAPECISATTGSSTSASTMARSSTTSQPTAMRPRSLSRMWRSCRARTSTTVLATERARPKTKPAVHDQPSSRASPAPMTLASAIWISGAGNSDARDRRQVLQREVQADAEHQQDDADLGQLAGQGNVGDEARRERPDHDACQQVADQRLDAQAVGDQAEDIGQHEARGDGGNERCLMLRHRRSLHFNR